MANQILCCLADQSGVNVDDVLSFLAMFNVPQLSEEMQKQEIIEMFVPCASGQTHLRAIMPYLQRFLLLPPLCLPQSELYLMLTASPELS